MARVLIPLPARDFDPSEAAVSWLVLSKAGHIVNFATPDGRPAVADGMMLTGQELDFWGQIPLLRNWPLIGLLMRANRAARDAYAAMMADPDYRAPTMAWIFASLSPTISFALIGVIVGEFIGAEKGIGRLIIESEARGEASGMMVAVTILMIVGVGLSAAIRRLQAYLLRWQQHNMAE